MTEPVRSYEEQGPYPVEPQSDIPWCVVWQDGHHGERQVVAAWNTPAGFMCNYHCSLGWPDPFITKTVTSAADADADLKGKK